MKAAVACFLPMVLALATFTEKDNCDRVCGNMSVPFPFGLDKICARNSDFILICNHTLSPSKLFLDDEILVFDISVVNRTIFIGIYMSYDCYDQSGNLLDESYPDTSFTMSEDGHYTFFDTRNKLTVLGCNTSTPISNAAGTFGSGCSSYCHEDINFTANSACSGLKCRQKSIPKSLRTLNISMNSTANYMLVQEFSSCGLAFVVDQESFRASEYKLLVPADIQEHVESKVVLNWVVSRESTPKISITRIKNTYKLMKRFAHLI